MANYDPKRSKDCTGIKTRILSEEQKQKLKDNSYVRTKEWRER